MNKTDSILARARAAVLAMKPYSSARSLVKGRKGLIYLDANECPYEPVAGAQGYARYADQQPAALIDPLCRLYDVSSRNLMVARGADEAIDILVRTFCEDGKDNVIVCPPTFPMYAHSARLQGAAVAEVPLTADFQLDIKAIENAADAHTKILFICCPNNPTGNLMKADDIEALCRFFAGRALVAVDETYIEYTKAPGFVSRVEKHHNLVVFRTLSKAYAVAGVRCGVAIAQGDVIDLMRRVLPPYPIPVPVVQALAEILKESRIKALVAKREETLRTRDTFIEKLSRVKGVEHIYPTDANYVLAKVKDAKALCATALENNIVLRDQSYQKNLDNCVRITIGAPHEMERLLEVLEGRAAALPKDMRTASIARRTKETAIDVTVNLDLREPVRISTGIGFYDHMLEQVARHGGFSLVVNCDGDLEIDAHHTVEDCAIALGQALATALGDKRGIARFGFTAPLDEALASVALDLSGRAYLDFDAAFPDGAVGGLPVDMVEHVFRSLCENLKATCHVTVKGMNTHHMVEACFKALGRTLGQAIRAEGDALPSTKGVL